MRMAIYGSDEQCIENQKEMLGEALAAVDQQAEIVGYVEERKLEEDLDHLDVVFRTEEALWQFAEYLHDAACRKKITMKAGKELRSFYVDDIYYVEAELSKVRLVMKTGCVLLPIGITEVEKRLEEEQFVKVHRSYLVNAQHIERICNRMVYMDNGDTIAISKYRLRAVKEQLGMIEPDRITEKQEVHNR